MQRMSQTGDDYILVTVNERRANVCGIICPGRMVKLNRSQAVNVHKLLTIRLLQPACNLIILIKGL